MKTTKIARKVKSPDKLKLQYDKQLQVLLKMLPRHFINVTPEEAADNLVKVIDALINMEEKLRKLA
jgi:hypothetical protein